MHKYIALLRGINVSGQKKISMASLSEMFNLLGCEEVRTYIQSGNVIFSHKISSCGILKEHIRSAILNTFGYDVAVLVKSPEDMRAIFQRNSYLNEVSDKGKLYFVFLSGKPGQRLINSLQQEPFEGEACTVTKECVYLICYHGMGKARLNNNLIEKRLKIEATTRNYRTVQKLLEMSGA